MNLNAYTPLQSLNKVFRKEKVYREDFDHFKKELRTLIQRINKEESEEHLKYPLRDFLKNTFYKDHEINTKGRTDLGIYLDNTDKSHIGVIIETKKPSNITDMITRSDPNRKAFQEAVLYYLRERNDSGNNEIKHIIITNLYEWFIFDAHVFERLFYKSGLNKDYIKWKTGQKTSPNTDLFYNEIVKPFLDASDREISCTWFDLRAYQENLDIVNKEADKKIAALYKIFSDVHILKKPFANDSNTLDRKFYNELLHIIGLEETKQGSKKIIGRKSKPDNASLLENTMATIEANEKLHKVENLEKYGQTKDEQLFNVALELVITWVNRILFLKLLEAQLVKYHQGDKDYKFMDSRFIADYDELNELFFEVLAKKENERKEYNREKFRNIPYLNSSLFELKPGSLEDNTILISNLKDRFKLPVHSQTVLKMHGKKLNGELSTLTYFFDFLEAYDFSSEGSEEIQEENKLLINASVLGLIFEKINGYKDGSFFTPGFITMYMCRETIRRAVLQKFNDLNPRPPLLKGESQKNGDEKYKSLNDIRDAIGTDFTRQQANEMINSLKICDPAVGSGHFLVSALNEIIAVKSELGILCYRNGNRIKDYKVEVANDELVITDKETEEIFEYRLNEKGRPVDYLQELQEAIFHEKQNIIENCLFGVDINPNSVNICRLRLWIELLKSAYYIFPGNYDEAVPWLRLQTLPNIDINIKCGNSLISRFPLDADLSKALKTIKYDINTYRACVRDYKSATSKDEKRSLEILINQIKNDFRTEIYRNDPKFIRLNKIKGDLVALTTQTHLFDLSPEQKQEFNDKVEKLSNEQMKLEKEISDIQNNIIFRNAFEWRFEFPEVLDDEGNFTGFDVVIGNPPYIRQEEIKFQKNYFQDKFKTYTGTADIYVFFVEKGFEILKQTGHFCFIMPNKWMQTTYGKPLRSFFLENELQSVVDFGDLQIFDEATTYPCILNAAKCKPEKVFNSTIIKTLQYDIGFEQYVKSAGFKMNISDLDSKTWMISSGADSSLLSKTKATSLTLLEYIAGKSFRGILTGLSEAFVINNETKERIIKEDANSIHLLKPFLLGRNIKPYMSKNVQNWLILIPKGFTIRKNLPADNPFYIDEPPPRYGYMPYDNAWQWFRSNYPAIAQYLLPFKSKAEKRSDHGDFWWELRACDYYPEFENPKIMYQVFQVKPCFIYDDNRQYCNNSMWIIPKDDKFLLGLLNSKMGWWLISKYCTAIQNGYQLIWKYFGQIPIPNISDNKKLPIKKFVDQILASKKENPDADIIDLEKKIDQLVYQLYGLTEEEIKIIESA